MKVLMYGWEFPPNISGGLGVACQGIVLGLIEKKVAVLLVLPNFAVPKQLSINSAQLTILPVLFSQPTLGPYTGHQFKQEKLKSQTVTAESKVTHLDNLDLFLTVQQYARDAGEFAKACAHDVIHAHDWLTILAGIAAKKISNKPLIFHVHSLEVERCEEPYNTDIFAIEKYGMEQADIIITVSEFTKQNIIAHYNIQPEKICVVHNGIFAEQISQSPRQMDFSKYKTVLFLGRMTHQKGPFHFIQMANKILQKRKDIQFVMAGDGDLFKDVVESVAEHRLGSHIHFTRFLDRKSVDEIYRRSHVYVMPSIKEPFGLVCLEALAQKIPVIISKQSGVSEVIKNTLKADFWDIDEMASKIVALIDYPALTQQLIENSQPELYQLLWSKAAAKITHIYQKLIEA